MTPPSYTSHTPPNPNLAFFSENPSDQWDIITYLDQHDPNLVTYSHKTVLDKWIKSLEAISQGEAYPPEQRDKARSLKLKYHSPGRHSDRNRARGWLNQQKPTAKKVKDPASVTIYKTSVNHGTFVNVEAANNTDSEIVKLGITYGTSIDEGALHNTTLSKRRSKRRLPEDWDSMAGAEAPSDEPTQHAQSPLSPSVLGEGGDHQEEGEEKGGEGAANSPRFKKLKTDHLAPFTAAFNSISHASKFRFKSTSRILEDVIYDNARNMSIPNLAHQWVLNLDDRDVACWFEETELNELRAYIPPLPKLDRVFIGSMARFADANTAAEFRQIVEEVPYRAEGEDYNRAKHFDAAWVNACVLSMLSILESPTNLLLYPGLREGWFDSNLWAILIDHCLLGLDGIFVQRKEINCFALKRNVTTPTYFPASPHPRFDAIVRAFGDTPSLEYGAIEVAHSFESINQPKWISDSTKLVRALRGMLIRLQTLVKHDEATVRALQVVGLMNAGAYMQMVRVGTLGVNVSWLQRGCVKNVPYEVPLLKGIFKILKSVVIFKEILKSTMDVMREYRGRKRALTEQEFRGLMTVRDEF